MLLYLKSIQCLDVRESLVQFLGRGQFQYYDLTSSFFSLLSLIMSWMVFHRDSLQVLLCASEAHADPSHDSAQAQADLIYLIKKVKWTSTSTSKK